MSGLVQVTTAVDSEAAARSIADTLVTERLAACAQVGGPIASTYWWEDRLEHATEWICVAKTTAAALAPLMARIRALHPYQQPEILATPVLAADPGYQAWAEAEVAARG
jgi:periplasmic divalent cation tolerance protein